MPTDFVAIVPPVWTSLIRSFLVRATEFQSKQPLVAYFLKTHVAFVCLRNRAAGGKEGTTFIMTLLKELEQDKAALGNELDKNDGRTVLTRMALMLFNKADDSERSGSANEATARMFYTASVLFEATGQYMDAGKLDPIAEEKSKYAKYVATRINKALTSGKPYQSHNPQDELLAGESEPWTPSSATVAAPQHTQPSVAQTATVQPPQATTSVSQQPVPSTQTHKDPAPLPPRQAPQQHPPQVQHTTQPHQQQQPGVGGPSLDAMIDAQKLCKNAVAALQFYDHENARKQLEAALRLLQN
ncbi:Hypothetical protein, putative [Bodo saltans]|uniref:Vacuolar protein sorting-associated protein VTA1 n=1 Tax=Bodo saltans TaxID=75058 RepID=A0A0S4IWD6_BODSA|nr:Hypothetical protein, putative [Bodo saltans]|eukprot:CUG05755.1 Hypothetical protein, putative [Bodo saltans]